MPVLLMRVVLMSLVLFLPPATTASAQAEPQPSSLLSASEVDRYAAALLEADRVPGAAVAIVRHGRLVYARGFGTDRRGREITGRTSFVLGSMSKAVTALAVMQLVERGQIALDTPVVRYLPMFRLATPDSGASVTVRHLLRHTSGIPQNAPRASGDQAVLGDHVRALREVTPARAAGATHEYASPNYLVLGAMIEAVSGRSFGEYVQGEIFGPLGMHNSFTDRARAEAQRFAGGHVYAFGYPVPSSVSAEPDRLPTAGLMSSAEDLAHFLSMQLQQGQFEGRQLLAASLVRQMHTGSAPADGFSYAFGWRDGQIAGVRAVHHGGIVSDFRGKMVMLPDAGWGVVVLTNVSSAMPWPIVPTSHQLADDIAAHLAGRPFPEATSRHRWLFAAVGAGMLALILAQLRSVVRAWRSGAPAVVWRTNLTDGAFLVFVLVLPSLVGLTWPELLAGAPDVGWWLAAMALLGVGTITVRTVRTAGARARTNART